MPRISCELLNESFRVKFIKYQKVTVCEKLDWHLGKEPEEMFAKLFCPTFIVWQPQPNFAAGLKGRWSPKGCGRLRAVRPQPRSRLLPWAAGRATRDTGGESRERQDGNPSVVVIREPYSALSSPLRPSRFGTVLLSFGFVTRLQRICRCRPCLVFPRCLHRCYHSLRRGRL